MSDAVSFRDVVKKFFSALHDGYLRRIEDSVKENPDLLKTLAGFLVRPTRVVLYFCPDHIVVEYEGPERVDEAAAADEVIPLTAYDYADAGEAAFDKIVGFSFADGTSGFRMPLVGHCQDLFCPTNRGMAKLLKLGWNLGAQDHLLSLNSAGWTLSRGQFARVVNSFFFDATRKGVTTRHIKWADCFPIRRIDEGDRWRVAFRTDVFGELAKRVLQFEYPVPLEFRSAKLQRINRFIEFFSAPERTEPEITRYLSRAANQFLVTMRFGAERLIPQPKLFWQSERRPPIQPDFLVVLPGGTAEICDFKLPTLKNSAVVGRANREKFSEGISSYVAQTRVYRDYFDDPNNRRWVKRKFGVNVLKPTRYLVIGTRTDLSHDDWRQIESDYRDLRILSYSDLIDAATAQLYR